MFPTAIYYVAFQLDEETTYRSEQLHGPEEIGETMDELSEQGIESVAVHDDRTMEYRGELRGLSASGMEYLESAPNVKMLGREDVQEWEERS